jgi:hypothetical protein
MKRIRLTESQLHRVIKESVNKIISELRLNTMQSAWEAMYNSDQKERADALKNTAIDGAKKRNDYLIPKIDRGYALVNIDKDSRPSNYTRNQMLQGYSSQDDDFINIHGDRGQALDSPDFPRYSNPKDARGMANNVRQLNPNTRYTDKGNFRY